MRTIVPFASNPLQVQMPPAQSLERQEHLAPPINPQELSRSGSPQHPDLLVQNSHSTPQSALQGKVDYLAKQPPPPPPPGMQPTWPLPNVPPPHHENGNAQPGPSTMTQRSSSKRRLDASDGEDLPLKIRRVVRDHIFPGTARPMAMTTVLCLHAAVAQKSYGSEKRFLCPPPVVHIEGPVWNMKQQQMSMAVVSEGGERTFEQKAPLDHNLTASFKFLHVTGSAKTKSFQLSLDIAEPPPAPVEGSEAAPEGRVWASFDSAPVTIISKPSKKTAKTRNISSCILAGGPVSLFNRINSQTVRTKYMTLEHSQLCASNIAWSAFNVNVVRAQADPPPLSGGPGPQPVTYGSEIVLADTVSGTQTAPLIIRKVDKGRIAADDGGPVSQMQKIALQRINADGSRQYLSAAGPTPGTPGVVVPPTPGLSSQAGSHPLLFQAPRIREEMKDGVHVIIDEVDDYLCWTIVGISKFQYTFFDAFGQNTTIPDMPITPFPTLFTAPVLRQLPNAPTALELTVANFFYDNPKTGVPTALDCYLGPLGPLVHRIYQAPPLGPITSVAPYMDGHVSEGPGALIYSTLAAQEVSMGRVRHMPGPIHTIVLVELPSIADVVKALREDAMPPHQDHPGLTPLRNGDSSGPGDRPPNDNAILVGRSLPLLFIRSYDGVGYHSGRSIACENMLQRLDLGNPGHPSSALPRPDGAWTANTVQVLAAADDTGLQEWALKVI